MVHSQSVPAGVPTWVGSLHVSLLELDFQHQGALAFRVQMQWGMVLFLRGQASSRNLQGGVLEGPV